MKAIFVHRLRGILVVALWTSLAASLAAQSSESTRFSPGPAVQPANDPDRSRLGTSAPTPNDSFGTSSRSVLWIPFSEFEERPGGPTATFAYDGIGYVHRTAGSGLMWAALKIPNGALIDSVSAWIADTSATGSISVILTRLNGSTDGFQDVGSASSSDGDTAISFSPNLTVDNSNNFYVVYINLPVDPNVRFKGVRVLWYRQVSAAPAVATFSDVPVGAPQFRFVEALAAAGITAGCGGSNFCPDQPLTRGQMAVFLAVALGLHHPF